MRKDSGNSVDKAYEGGLCIPVTVQDGIWDEVYFFVKSRHLPVTYTENAHMKMILRLP